MQSRVLVAIVLRYTSGLPKVLPKIAHKPNNAVEPRRRGALQEACCEQKGGRSSLERPCQSLSKRLETEDLGQQNIQHGIPTIRVATVLVAAVVAVFITAPEPFAEIVVVIVLG